MARVPAEFGTNSVLASARASVDAVFAKTRQFVIINAIDKSSDR